MNSSGTNRRFHSKYWSVFTFLDLNFSSIWSVKCHNDVQHSNVNFMIYVTLAHIKYNLTFACVRHCGGCIWTTSICCRIWWCWLLCCNSCRVDISSSTWSLSLGLYFRLCNNSRCSIVCCIRGVDWFRCSWYIN